MIIKESISNKKGDTLEILHNMTNSSKLGIIIPGLGEDKNERHYAQIARELTKANIAAVRVNLSNNQKNKLNFAKLRLSDHINDIEIIYNRYRKEFKDIFLLGFSFGAVSAFITSTSIAIQKQVLCSPGNFHDYLSTEDKELISVEFLNDLKKYNWKQLTPKIRAETYIVYGTKELQIIKQKAMRIYQELQAKKHLVRISNATHNLSQKDYMGEVIKIVNKL